MSAARLDTIWDTQNEFTSFAVRFIPTSGPQRTRRVGSGRRPARCPECDSVIYSRRHRLCGVCNQPLPEHLLFDGVESQRVETLLSTERQRHRRWMEQRTKF